MRENRLRKIWESGGFAVNGWLHIPSGYAAEQMAHQDWDSLTIDLQHGPVSYADAVPMLQAISTTETVPLARVPWNEPGVIMKMLDAGCYGIICPMVNSQAEAEAFVGACRYPPQGYRSYGPNRASLYGGKDYFPQANETVVTIAMIETAQALAELDEILSVPGLDAIYVGPADLSISMGGRPGADFTTEPVMSALTQIVEGCKRHGVVAGIHNRTPAYSLRAIEMGFQFVTMLSDVRLMVAGAQEVVTAVKNPDASPGEAEGPY